MVAHDDPAWMFDGESEAYYTPAPPKLLHAHDGEKVCVGILPDQDLSTRLQSAILEHRKTKIAEDKVDVELDNLDQELRSLRREVRGLEQSVADIEEPGTMEESEKLASMREEIAALRQRQKEVQQLQDDVHRKMDDMYGTLRHNQYELFDKLDTLLVDCALMPPAHEGSSQTSRQGDVGLEPESGTAHGGRPGKASIDELMRPSSEARPRAIDADASLQRMPGINDLKRTRSIKEAVKSLQAEIERDPKPELLYNFRMKRTLLHQAEDELDHRHETFDGEADERDRKLAEGEQFESCTELGMRQLRHTQKLTRRVIDAEKAFEEVKAAAIHGGVQFPGSDIQSGFVDDVDDGYRMSLEEEMCASVDPARILNWLRKLPDTSAVISDDARAQKAATVAQADIDIDDWDAKSVEISDSASMVANGPERRRIDRWQAACVSTKT